MISLSQLVYQIPLLKFDLLRLSECLAKNVKDRKSRQKLRRMEKGKCLFSLDYTLLFLLPYISIYTHTHTRARYVSSFPQKFFFKSFSLIFLYGFSCCWHSLNSSHCSIFNTDYNCMLCSI